MIRQVFLNDVNEIIERVIDIAWKLKNKSIFITGVTGMIGEMITEVFLQLNRQGFHCDLNVVIREKKFKMFKERWQNQVNFIIQDLNEPIVCNRHIDYIFHIAGESSVSHKYNIPSQVLRTNILGIYHVLEFAKQNQIKGMLFVSSASVYGNTLEKKMKESEMENAGLNPMLYFNCYAESKRAGECFCSAYGKQYHIPIKVVRPFLIYGSNLRIEQDGLIQDIINAVRTEQQNIQMKSDGSAIRNFCYITDCVVAMFFVMLCGHSQEAYNVGSIGGTITVKEFVKILTGKINRKKKRINVFWSIDESRKQINYIPDFCRLSDLGYTSCVSTEQGITKMLEGIKNYYELHDLW